MQVCGTQSYREKYLWQGLTTYEMQESIYSRQIAVRMVALYPSSWADVSNRHSNLFSQFNFVVQCKFSPHSDIRGTSGFASPYQGAVLCGVLRIQDRYGTADTDLRGDYPPYKG